METIKETKPSTSPWRFWFPHHATAIVTIPIALITTYLAIRWAVNGLFFNLVLALSYGKAWFYLFPLLIALGFLNAVLTVMTLFWIPALWRRKWNIQLRLFAMVLLWLGTTMATLLIGYYQWKLAEPKYGDFASHAPAWLAFVGVEDPYYVPAPTPVPAQNYAPPANWRYPASTPTLTPTEKSAYPPAATAAARRCDDTKKVVVSNTADDDRKTDSSNSLQVSGMARNTCNYPLSATLRITALAQDGSVLGTATRSLSFAADQEQPFVVWLTFNDIQRSGGGYGSVQITPED